MKRKTALVLCLMLMLSLMSPFVLADGAEESAPAVQPRYSYITSIAVSIDLSPTWKTTDVGQVILSDSTCSAVLIMELQQLDGYWKEIKQWSDSGSRTVILDETWYVLSGYQYRAVVTAYVYNADNELVETASVISQVVP